MRTVSSVREFVRKHRRGQTIEYEVHAEKVHKRQKFWEQYKQKIAARTNEKKVVS